jgi:hypothetical protein
MGLAGLGKGKSVVHHPSLVIMMSGKAINVAVHICDLRLASMASMASMAIKDDITHEGFFVPHRQNLV